MNNTNHNKPPVMGIASGLDPVRGEHGGRIFSGMQYDSFLGMKRFTDKETGIEPSPTSEMLFPFQSDIVRWALKRGRAAIFADCGMGKTAMQLEWARQIPGRVLIAAPLAVSSQTVREGAKFGVDVTYGTDDTGERIMVTNTGAPATCNLCWDTTNGGVSPRPSAAHRMPAKSLEMSPLITLPAPANRYPVARGPSKWWKTSTSPVSPATSSPSTATPAPAW